MKKGRLLAETARFRLESTLARLEAALNLVDHVNPALAADQTVVAVATTQRFQRVTDLHGTILMR
jgi:predicted component of type VI protein secretion system